MTWTTLTMKVVTPLFNNGADQDSAQDAGVRVASIRGAMRFWFRALAGTVTGTTSEGITLLAAMERRIFGGPKTPSACVLRIPAADRKLTVISPHQQHSFIAGKGPLEDRRKDPTRWIVYLLGQGLADLADMTVTKPYVKPGSSFRLMIRFAHRPGDAPKAREAVQAMTYAALWLTCTLGGIGARTRRGFGAIRTIAVSTDPPPLPWEPETLLTPGLDYFEGLASLDATQIMRTLPDWDEHLATLRDLVIAESAGVLHAPADHDRPANSTTSPTFPVLSAPHTAFAVSQGPPFPTWTSTLIETGRRLRTARATQRAPAAKYQPRLKTYEWLNVVHGAQENRFDLAAFGLPVVFNKQISVNAMRSDGQDLRRASMLWLRPVSATNGSQWRMLSIAFLTQFLPGPEPAHVILRKQGEPDRELNVTTTAVVQRAKRWMQRPVIHKPK